MTNISLTKVKQHKIALLNFHLNRVRYALIFDILDPDFQKALKVLEFSPLIPVSEVAKAMGNCDSEFVAHVRAILKDALS